MRARLIATEVTAELNRWAELYGRPPVSLKNVRMWYERRARNGYPESVGVREDHPAFHRKPMEWDAAEVLTWYLAYVPDRGGRPRTNTDG